MPYEWNVSDPHKTTLHAWPYRSLLKRDFSRFIWVSCFMFGIPLVAVLGSPVMWVLLGFFVVTIVAVTFAIQRSYKDGYILETLTITPETMTLEHRPAKGDTLTWEAQTYWVRSQMEPTAGPVPDYITLSGNNREVELGRFLSEDERPQLYSELRQALARAKDISPNDP